MRSYEFLRAASIPLCLRHQTGHPSCAALLPKCPRAPPAPLGLPGDKPSLATCPLTTHGLSPHEGRAAEGAAWSPASLESPLSRRALQVIPALGSKKLKLPAQMPDSRTDTLRALVQCWHVDSEQPGRALWGSHVLPAELCVTHRD